MNLETFIQEKNLSHVTVQEAIKAYKKWEKQEEESAEEKEYKNFVYELETIKDIVEYELKQEKYTSLLNKYLKVQAIIEKNKEIFDSFHVVPIEPECVVTSYQKKYVAMWAYLFNHPWIPIFVEDNLSDDVRISHFCKHENFLNEENFDVMFFDARSAWRARRYLVRYKKEFEKK